MLISMNEPAANSSRHLFLLILVFGSLALVMLQSPIQQDLAYHTFVDSRTKFGIKNFYNVVSNLAFLLTGVAGAVLCRNRVIGFSGLAWMIFFVGIALVGLGSAYYHLNPDNERLLWDRLPMTVGFMGMFAALLGEFVYPRLTRYFLFPLMLTGMSSVLIWHAHDDLRLYVWVQFMPMLVIPALLLMYPKSYSHTGLIMLALLSYVIAKLLETFDAQVFLFFQDEMGGHAIKHVFAALGAATILWMLRVRRRLSVQ